MSSEDWLGEEPMKTKSKKKSKGAPINVVDELIDETFDAMLESASKHNDLEVDLRLISHALLESANLAASIKAKSARRPTAEAASGWSNDIDGDEDSGDTTNIIPSQPPILRQSSRRAAEEIIATDIPTIPMDEADGDDAIDLTPQVAVAPEFSVYQISSFKDIENEFSRERASQYIDSKIDIGILYHNLHLQEELDAEDQKPWDWDKLFVEVRNSITNPTIDS